MSGIINVDPQELRTHSAHIQDLVSRIESVRSASSAIAQADDAFGPLCAWMAPILEEKHGDTDTLIDQAKANLETHVTELGATADAYEEADAAAASDFDGLSGAL
jgi:uncharacterized protein YukE